MLEIVTIVSSLVTQPIIGVILNWRKSKEKLRILLLLYITIYILFLSNVMLTLFHTMMEPYVGYSGKLE